MSTAGLQVLARARVHDPLSSVRAARLATDSGAASSQAGWFLSAVRERPGLTASELAERSGGTFDRVQANRRLADLRRLGLVETGPSRTSAVTARMELTWEPKPSTPAWRVPTSEGARQEGLL